MAWFRNRSDSKARSTIRFLFENTTIRVSDGTWFSAGEDAVERWIQSNPASFDVLIRNFRIVYRLTNDDYLLVEYAGCHVECPPSNDENQEEIEHWASSQPPRARRFEPVEAAHFFMQNQFRLPQELRDAWERWEDQMRNPQPATPRPLSFWVENCPPGILKCQHSHDVDLLKVSEDILNLLAMVIQQIVEWEQDTLSSHQVYWFLSCSLFANYEVNIPHWNARYDVPPPKSIDLLDIDWPADLQPIHSLLQRLREIIIEPISCLARSARPYHSDNEPILEDMMVAHSALADAKPELDQLYSDLNRVIRQLRSKSTQSETSGDDEKTEQTIVLNSKSDHVEMTFTDPEERPLPILELIPGGVRFNQQEFELKGKAWDVLNYTVARPGLKIIRDQALSAVWPEQSVGDNSLDQAITKIRKLFREILFLTDKVDPFPQIDQGKNAAWQLAVRFQVVQKKAP